MTTPESADRGQQGRGRSPSEAGSIFSANFPPVDLQKEGPTKEDKLLANSGIPTIETRIGDFMSGQKGAASVSVPIAVGIGLGSGLAGGAIFWGLDRAFGSEKPESREINGPTSFNKDGSVAPQLVGLPPFPLEQPNLNKVETTKVDPDEASDNNATTEVITPAMKKEVPREEIQQLDSFARLENQKTEIVTAKELIEQIPLRKRKMYPSDALNVSYVIGEDKNTLKLLYPLDLSQTPKKDAVIKLEKSFGAASIGGDIGEALFKDEGYSDKIEFLMEDGSSIPKGTIVNMFLANKTGSYMMKSMVEGDRGGQEALIDVQALNGNIYRFLVIALKGEGLATQIVSLEPLVDVPEFKPEFNRMPIGTYGYNVRSGEPSLKLAEDAHRIEIFLLVSHKGNTGETSRSRPGLSPFVVTNLKMFVSDGKVVIPEPSSNTLDTLQKHQ
ncbi:MAG: hypothetical protein AAB600_03000 [Patescibacteria group bacterium]